MYHLIWLEDEPISIEYRFLRPLKEYPNITVHICESYDEFCDEVAEIEDKTKMIFVLDIRMMLNTDKNTPCFEKDLYNQ
ncbi:MAG: hypothetical protein Q9M36_14725 [Sulfurovum sp.]|nr:hypothetical protein [Sulfurovum sp.]